MDKLRAVPFLLAPLMLLGPADALAQGAWVPAKGELIVTPTFQYLDAGKHLFSDSVLFGVDRGSKSLDFGTVQSQVFVLDIDFGVTDRLAVNGALAYVGARYIDDGVFGGPEGPRDDGTWNNGFQDGRIGVRYTAFDNGTWVLTPSAYYGFPTTDYATLGHAALGRRLNELRLGLEWARMLYFSGVPKAYLQGSLSYAFMENPEEASVDRSNLLVGFGYFFRYLTVHASTEYQNVHGGIDWAGDLRADAPRLGAIFGDHDRAAAADFWRLGGGVSVPISSSLEAYGSVATTLWGINTHKGTTITTGVSWRFQLYGGNDWW